MNATATIDRFRNCIMFNESEQALLDGIDEFYVTHGHRPDVIVTPLPLIGETPAGECFFVQELSGIPVAVCELPHKAVLLADTETFCNLKQLEAEQKREQEVCDEH